MNVFVRINANTVYGYSESFIIIIIKVRRLILKVDLFKRLKQLIDYIDDIYTRYISAIYICLSRDPL